MVLETINCCNFWKIITERGLREDNSLRDFIRRFQPEIVFEGIKAIKGLEDKEEIARRLALLIEINVEDPQLIGASHSVLEARRLRIILDQYKYYQDNYKSELYEKLISDLEADEGLLKYLIDFLQQERERLGIVTPFSIEMLVGALANQVGINKDFRNLTLEDWNRIISSFKGKEANIVYSELLPIIKPDYIWTRTGLGRNLTILSVFKEKWQGGTYVDIGGSVGVNSLEIGEEVGFSKVVSLDKMKEEEALAITQIIDYRQGKPIEFNNDLRRKVKERVEFFWRFNAVTEKLSDRIKGDFPPPLVIGIHNLLVHLRDKKAVILNALNMIGENGYLWISGGFIANSPVLYNFILKIENGRVVSIFVDKYDERFKGGDGRRIEKLEEMR